MNQIIYDFAFYTQLLESYQGETIHIHYIFNERLFKASHDRDQFTDTNIRNIHVRNQVVLKVRHKSIQTINIQIIKT